MIPFACAKITGNTSYPELSGTARFYQNSAPGVWVEVEVIGLPTNTSPFHNNFFGMHIHENGDCTPPFNNTGALFNPLNTAHPNHAGDLPPLPGNDGYGFISFYTNRFAPKDIINRSIIIHSTRDDFTTQPAGDSGVKIGCGVIEGC